MMRLLNLLIEKKALLKHPEWSKGNHCATNGKYFVYIGEFPKLHVAIDSSNGTDRLHTITDEGQLNKFLTLNS